MAQVRRCVMNRLLKSRALRRVVTFAVGLLMGWLVAGWMGY